MQRWAIRSERRIRLILVSQVKLLTNATRAEFEASVAEFKPTFLYIGSGASFGQNAEQGSLLPFSFKGDKFIISSGCTSDRPCIPLTMQTDLKQVEF